MILQGITGWYLGVRSRRGRRRSGGERGEVGRQPNRPGRWWVGLVGVKVVRWVGFVFV
jgi:hypothetical protein